MDGYESYYVDYEDDSKQIHLKLEINRHLILHNKCALLAEGERAFGPSMH